MALLKHLAINLFFIGYFIWLQPPILERLSATPETNDISLGLVLIGIQLAEMTGVWLKYPGIIQHLHINRNLKPVGMFLTMILTLTHIFISAMLAISTIQAFGVELGGTPPLLPTIAALLFFFIVLTKEGLVLQLAFIFLGKGVAVPQKTHSPAELALRDSLGDILLAAFAALTYTVVWDGTLATAPLEGQTFWQHIVEFFGAALFFFMVFPATRATYYALEWNTHQTKLQRVLSSVFTLAMMVTAYLSIPRSIH